jgi:hypothetical protein
MNFKAYVSDDFIDCLLDMEHLEEIHIAGCSYLTVESVLRLLRIKSLRLLDISCCYGFTNDFIIQAASIIKDCMPKERLLIIVGCTEINQAITKQHSFEDCKKYIQLSWTAAKNIEHDYDIDEENRTDNQEIMQYNLDGEMLMLWMVTYLHFCLFRYNKYSVEFRELLKLNQI